MIISETVLRRRVRSLLLEMQVYPLKDTLEDIEFYRDFEEGEFEKIEQRLRSNWDRGYSKYSQVIKKDVINTEEPVDHILDAIDSFIPYYSKVGPQMQAEIGRGDLTSSNLRGYVEGKASDKLNKTRTDQRIACRRQVPIREDEECKDFKVIHADSDWTVVYPKTMIGSMSWAVGLADGSEEKYEVNSYGKQVGRVLWCTAAYTNNRFFMYAGNLHMYYFVKNSGYDISDVNRRLCVTWIKDENTEEVQIHHGGNATVDADNIDLREEKMLSLIGQEIVEKMRVDASSRKATSLAEMASKVTLPMLKQDMENLKDDPTLLKQQLNIYAQHAKDVEVIEFLISYDKRYSLKLASRHNLDKDLVIQLAKNKNCDVRLAIARRSDLPEELIRQLAKDEISEVRRVIAKKKDLPEDLIREFARDESSEVRSCVAIEKDLPEDLIRQLAQDESSDVRFSIVRQKDLPEDLIMQLAQDESNDVRLSIVRQKDLPEDLIRQLAQDKSVFIRREIAKKKDLPEDLIRQLAQDKSVFVRREIAYRLDLPVDIVLFFAEDTALSIKRAIARNPNLTEDLIKKFLEDADKSVVNSAIENPSITDSIFNNLIEKSKILWEESEYDDGKLDTLISIIRNPKFKRHHIDVMEKNPSDIVELLTIDDYIEVVYNSYPHLREIIRESGREINEDNLEESRLLRSYINMLLN